MYYRSMRKEIYKIGREYSTRFMIIYVLTSLQNCLERNLNRPKEIQISEEVSKNKPHNIFNLFFSFSNLLIGN